MIAHADPQPSEEGVQQDADADRRPCRMPEDGDDSQMHGNEKADFNGLELVANGDGRRGRQRHTNLSHEDYLKCLPGRESKPAVFSRMNECPVEFGLPGRRAKETNPRPFAKRSAWHQRLLYLCAGKPAHNSTPSGRSEKLAPLCGRVFDLVLSKPVRRSPLANPWGLS